MTAVKELNGQKIGQSGIIVPLGGLAGDEIVKNSSADLDFTIRKNKIDAIIAPTVDNDSTEGYSLGSKWMDTVGLKVYKCFDATVGAAIWIDLTGGGGAEWIEIERQTVLSPVTSVDFINKITDDYENYRIRIIGMKASTTYIFGYVFGYGVTPTWLSSYYWFIGEVNWLASTWGGANGSGTPMIYLTSANKGSFNEMWGTLLLRDLRSTTYNSVGLYDEAWSTGPGSAAIYGMKGWGTSPHIADPIDHIRLKCNSTQTINQGIFILEGSNTYV